jgi:hypothetical protein
MVGVHSPIKGNPSHILSPLSTSGNWSTSVDGREVEEFFLVGQRLSSGYCY